MKTINVTEAIKEVNDLLVNAEIKLVRLSGMSFDSETDEYRHSRKLNKLKGRIDFLKYWVVSVESVA